MTARLVPTAAHVLLCRGPHCSFRAPQLERDAVRFAEEQHIAYYRRGGTVRLTMSSCLGACDHGPIVVCYQPHDPNFEAWYAGMAKEQVETLLRSLQQKTALPKEGRFDVHLAMKTD